MDIRIDATDARLVDIGDIKPYDLNAKKHPMEQVNALASRIKKDGFDQAIVVDEHYVILKGHGRRLAAIQLGMKQVPVVVKHGLTEAHKRACRIADNKVAETDWDIDLLRVDLKGLKAMDEDFSDLGFDQKELDDLKLDLDLADEQGDTFKKDPGSLGTNAVISYQLIFDDEGQQNRWYAFIKGLKEQYPDAETAAGRIIAFIDEAWEG